MSAYPHAFRPIEIGGLKLANRLFMSAHTTNYGAEHLPTERHLEYHRARARGGVGLIVFESIRVMKNSLGRPQAVNGYDRRCIGPFARIAAAVHAEGVKLLGQVIHVGRQIDGDFERTLSFGPSPIPWAATAQVPHAMTRDDMDAVIAAHVLTARNLLEAGLDGIELHVGHGHLLQQFVSPLSNARTDAYGGSTENRLRFPIEVLRAVRAAVGSGVCLGIRFSAEEFIDGGLTLDESCRAVPMLARAVKLDFVHVSHSAYHGSYSLATQMADMGFDPAMFRPLPAAIRAALHADGSPVPVFSVCRYRSLAEAERMLASGGADMVGMARALLADPDLVRKSREGREAEVRPCIGCNQGCAGMLDKNLPLTCLINPRGGIEYQWPAAEDDRAAARRRVLVVGGGPAGLEAAWVAAARGHDVTLWERDARLGGQVNWIRAMPHRAEFLKLLDHQERQCRTHGVAIETGRAADAAAIAAFAPDRTILATGSTPQAIAYPGGRAARTLPEALADPAALGARVAFVDLIGEWSALAAIEHLARLGKAVTVFVPHGNFAWRTSIYSNLANRKRLRDLKVRIALLRAVRDWSPAGLLVEDTSTGETETLAGFDSVVGARYNAADDRLYRPLRERGLAVETIGDAAAPRTALEAVYEGHFAARRI